MNRTILATRVRQLYLGEILIRLPVDASDDVVHSEGRVVVVILPPYLTSWPDAIVGAVEGIVKGHDDSQQPGDDSQDLVSDDGVLGVGFALGEGIDYSK